MTFDRAQNAERNEFWRGRQKETDGVGVRDVKRLRTQRDVSAASFVTVSALSAENATTRRDVVVGQGSG